jgi:Ca-activated chloride channel homolog
MSRVSRSGRACLILLLGVALALIPSSASLTAQDARTATLIGTVVDYSGVVPGASVAATLVSTRVTRSAVTNERGVFRLAALAPGRYAVTISMEGFKQIQTELSLTAGEVRDLGRLTLTAGGVNETVNVTADRYLSINGGNSLNRNTTIDGVPVGVEDNGATRITPHIDSVAPAFGEHYAHVEPNRFRDSVEHPLSTFGADVDTASYTNVRRFLSLGRLPPTDAVRVEEMINYFPLEYPQPRDGRPVSITTEIGDCPWAPAHRLVLIGVRAKAPARRDLEGRNIVLLIDVSGSMAPPNRLPMLKAAFAQLVDTLRQDDRVAIVTYAGASGIALPSTPVSERDAIRYAIDRLSAGGSTNGGSGIQLAYRAAHDAFIPGGVNRVILATDGDFNVGVTSQQELVRLIERERESGIFLSVLGVGEGNLKDSTMELLADRGNGNYSYLDSLQEARRVLIREGDSTLETVAKDVKFQVEFNPAEVSAWKLIGYENRRLAAAAFNDDRKDGGELGANRTVTVLYEVVPAGTTDMASAISRPDVDPLRYQATSVSSRVPRRPGLAAAASRAHAGEWLAVKVRYKAPDSDTSELLERDVRAGGPGPHLALASAVADFGLLLQTGVRDDRRWESLSKRLATIEVPRSLAADKAGFADLVEIAKGLSTR